MTAGEGLRAQQGRAAKTRPGGPAAAEERVVRTVGALQQWLRRYLGPSSSSHSVVVVI